MTHEDRDLILRIEAKVDRLIDRYDAQKEIVADHEDRLRGVEKWRNALPVSTLLFMATTTVALIALFTRG